MPGGRRARKTEDVFECLGNLDETNAQIGMAASFLDKKFPLEQLYTIQSNILSIGACLASDEPDKAKILAVIDGYTDKLESQIDEWDKKMPKLKNFILPGGKSGGAALHLCRTIIRRAERSYQRLDRKAELVPVGRYLNRLSDYFFQAARYANFIEIYSDQIWEI